MMPTPNDELAANVGQDKPMKEPIEAEDAKRGTYQCPVQHTELSGQPPSPKQGSFVKKGG